MSRARFPQRYLRHAAAALLQSDRPVPPRGDDEIAAEVERNYRWNFAVNLLDGASFWFGLSFISSSTIIPLFVSKLTSSALLIGLVAVIGSASWALPQIFTANFTERMPRKKPIIVNLGFFLERLPLWILVASAAVAGQSPALALLLFFVGYAWHGLGAGMVAPAWQELIARCFPVDRRGRFFGITMFIGAGTAAAGAALSTWLLKTFAFAQNFVLTFAIAAASITVSWIFLALAREPAQAVDAPRKSNRQFLAELPSIVRRDHNFRRFLVARSTLTFGSLGTGFITVSAIYRWQIADSVVGVYTIVYMLGQTAGTLAFGFLADRFGHKLSLEIGALASAIAFLLALLAPSPGWIFAVFFLLGITVAAVLVSGIMVTLEFSSPQRRPTYVGIANTTIGIIGILAPLLGAWLASHSYEWLFGVGAAANLTALIALRWWVKEPRWAPTIEFPQTQDQA
jgi:MFS family permease